VSIENSEAVTQDANTRVRNEVVPCLALGIVNRILICTLCVFLFQLGTTQAADYAYQAEADYFEKHVTDSDTLLTSLYKESKVLLLGAANHRNMQHHLILIDLLKQVGTDPKLKYLVLEQSYENDDLYRDLSFDDVFTVLRTHQFGSDHERLLTLCWSREWTWVYTHLFPIVQESTG
jgi:hypothetical protein